MTAVLGLITLATALFFTLISIHDVKASIILADIDVEEAEEAKNTTMALVAPNQTVDRNITGTNSTNS